MKLEEFRRTHHNGVEYIGIGNSNATIRALLYARTGGLRFYTQRVGGADESHLYKSKGLYPLRNYYLEERDFELFNAFNELPDDWEMLGYGNGELFDDDYDYAFWGVLAKKFHKCTEDIEDITGGRRAEIDIHIRKKKSSPKLAIEVGKKYIQRNKVVAGFIKEKISDNKYVMETIEETTQDLLYKKDGICWGKEEGSLYDLIKEYKEGANDCWVVAADTTSQQPTTHERLNMTKEYSDYEQAQKEFETMVNKKVYHVTLCKVEDIVANQQEPRYDLIENIEAGLTF